VGWVAWRNVSVRLFVVQRERVGATAG